LETLWKRGGQIAKDICSLFLSPLTPIYVKGREWAFLSDFPSYLALKSRRCWKWQIKSCCCNSL
jgi:hypothetical protein